VNFAVICAFLAALSLASVPGRAADRVAQALDLEISRAELAAAGNEPAQVVRLTELVWTRVTRHYVAARGLDATSEDLAELSAYDREFERRDRAQRARKLAELNERLARDGLTLDERAHLEEFRAVLGRLALDETRSDTVSRDPGEPPPQYYRSGIEMWKMNKALYEEYGGTVALTVIGPEPHSARAALIADYERRGLVRFADMSLRKQVFALLAQPPPVVVPPDQVDFTPYWKLPIPPSYFPD